MNPTRLKSLVLIIVLITATGAALAYSTDVGRTWLSDLLSPSTRHYGADPSPVSLGGHLVQSKVLQGSSGRVNLALTLAAIESPDSDSAVKRNVDMIIVLDRSGSMKGQKINDARQAISNLLSRLTAKDRFALITYSDGVQFVSGLKPVTASHRQHRQH